MKLEDLLDDLGGLPRVAVRIACCYPHDASKIRGACSLIEQARALLTDLERRVLSGDVPQRFARRSRSLSPPGES